ncbi:MAG TPA: hypothetical protein PKE31_19615 [Pseudomonadota bacterium]|nr:hypothetical protein [Pseudomonadota bacterium]
MSLVIEADWEALGSGSECERACFSALGIRHGDLWLTEAEDTFVRCIRQKVHLSAYPLAEWLAWNYWRLRFEPHKATLDWALAHRLATIGGGYVWPNITVVSDGKWIDWVAKPTVLREKEPLRYVSDARVVVSENEFEHAIDGFVEQVLGRLRAEGIADNPLLGIWTDVRAERADPKQALRRKLEALLGCDPDQASVEELDTLVADSASLGTHAMEEVAAGRKSDAPVWTGDELRQTARSAGFDLKPADAVRWTKSATNRRSGSVIAHELGAQAAQALRDQERLGVSPISNQRLAELSGMSVDVLTGGRKAKTVSPTGLLPLSFALDQDEKCARIVLRSRWKTGRRFDAARLLFDRMLSARDKEALFPATAAYTYRQKAQRAFAAEFLCPFSELEGMLQGDYSSWSIEEAASHFDVSELAVKTALVNHGYISRETLTADCF